VTYLAELERTGKKMKAPVQITFRDVEHSDVLETQIREKVENLETCFGAIISCRVTVEIPHQHKHQGKLFNVRINIDVPGGEIVVDRDQHEDVYVALRDAFDAAKRQLEDRSRRLHRDSGPHPQE
jgi:ribosomal subunit interface protein